VGQNADDLGSASQCRIGYGAHQADASAAVYQADASRGERSAQCAGLGREGRVIPVRRSAVDRYAETVIA
jgi:hypothetical protein